MVFGIYCQLDHQGTNGHYMLYTWYYISGVGNILRILGWIKLCNGNSQCYLPSWQEMWPYLLTRWSVRKRIFMVNSSLVEAWPYCQRTWEIPWYKPYNMWVFMGKLSPRIPRLNTINTMGITNIRDTPICLVPWNEKKKKHFSRGAD